jgi:glycosyltransferase involved in cell wall biosynthesis
VSSAGLIPDCHFNLLMLVSAIIPTYNRADTIKAAVVSVLSQTHPDMEVIVVDDGSSDTTLDVLAEFGEAIRVIQQANAGPSAARNHGVVESRGEIISFLDSDDIWKPEKITEQIHLMEMGGKEMCCCVCNSEIIGLNGEPAGDSFASAGLRVGITQGEWLNPGEVLATRFLLFNQVVAVRRTAFDSVGGFNRDLRILEDYELAMKLSAAGRWGIINRPLVSKRNDTDGIGVACMKDTLKHVATCVEVISGILTSGHGLSDSAKRQLQHSLDELRLELRAEKALHGQAPGGTVAAHAIKTLLKFKKLARRASPSWPRPRFEEI